MSESIQPGLRQPPVEIARLEAFIASALVSVGIPTADAAQVAKLMAESDAYGGDAHGIFRLRQYVSQIENGAINARPNIRVINDRPGTALLDGDGALGHLVMTRAAQLAIEKAALTGIGWVGTQHSNHAGPAHLYARMPMQHDMIGLYFCVGNANLVPPWA